MFDKTAILGASRGLGAELAKILKTEGGASSLFLASRKLEPIKSSSIHQMSCDFTKAEDQTKLFEALKTFSPTLLLYVAGGGPYGEFFSKSWKDHAWALELNLLFPAKLLHFAGGNLENLKEALFIGSDIAEAKPDPRAASYSASKHGLRGLLISVAEENPRVKVRLYSPGYMDTLMLPPNAKARQSGQVIHKPNIVAQDIVQWLRSGDTASHRKF